MLRDGQRKILSTQEPRLTTVRIFVFLSIVIAVVALGQFSGAPPSIDPPDPTSKDAVTLIVQQIASCPPPPEMSRSGFEIAVTLRPGPCLSPPVLITHHIELGVIPSGQYHVVITAESGQSPFTFSFVVLDANSGVAVSQSVGSTAGGTTINIVVAAAHCLNHAPTACPPPSITFGGVPATNVVVIDQSHFRATTPPHATGAVQVSVTGDSFVKTSYAFRYYDPTAPPSDKFFVKVLIPVIFNGPGALGSNWSTELSLRNDNDYLVEPWRPIAGSSAIAPVKPISFGSGSAPSGAFLILPRQAAAGVSFHAAVRDTSRADREWATEIPVVRENDFSSSGVELLDIPVDSRFRTMVRVYSMANPVPAYTSFVHIIVYSIDDGSVLRDVYPSLSDPTGCSDATSCAAHPSFASVSDLTAGLPSGRVGVQVQGNVPLWAFATVTNNETQHVTVVSPH
jgi:hypothetical protein